MKSKNSQQIFINFLTVISNAGLERRQSFRQVDKKSE
jgi:hypothetical protein